MKKKFLSRFDVGNLWKTVICLIIAVSLIAISFAGEYFNDNGLMILMFIIGFVLFFYAMLHPWGKVSYYFILMVIFIILFTLVLIGILIKIQLGEAIGMSIVLICAAAVIAGIIGIFTFSKGWQRLPYMGAALSLLVVPIWLFMCILHPNLKSFILVSYWMLFCIQLLITISLFSMGYINRKESRLSKVALIIIPIILIMMGFGLWGFMATLTTNARGFEELIRICVLVDIIVALIVFYACLKIPKPDKV